MPRNAASKVMWGGRATVFSLGLGVLLALVFGVVPGGVFLYTVCCTTRVNLPFHVVMTR